MWQAILAVAAALSALAYGAIGWRRLAHTPAVTGFGPCAGIAGFVTPTGRGAMFCRMHPGPGRDAPPIVLVHGLVISSRYMEPLAAVLGRRFRVYAPDLPGFGESARAGTGTRRARSVTELADALYRWALACHLGRATYIGNSFGCQVLAEFAAKHPRMVERLILQAPTPEPGARSFATQLWRALINGRRERQRSPAAIGRIDYAKAGLPRAIATIRLALRDRPEDRLPDIAAPTLVVVGTRDPLVRARWAAEVSRRLPDGSLLSIAGGTHTLNYVYPHSFAQAIEPFLDGRTGTGALPSRQAR